MGGRALLGHVAAPLPNLQSPYFCSGADTSCPRAQGGRSMESSDPGCLPDFPSTQMLQPGPTGLSVTPGGVPGLKRGSLLALSGIRDPGAASLRPACLCAQLLSPRPSTQALSHVLEALRVLPPDRQLGSLGSPLAESARPLHGPTRRGESCSDFSAVVLPLWLLSVQFAIRVEPVMGGYPSFYTWQG
ncbi:hypothetical protein NDU88_004907 [Pleurodeles waltl]|uniref:Uncharacterized protein n=1 Tax=Pleurodeles waltl TaxID=8319 RepID=A0AAV7MV78_PLEWA|nr:hypothetical protein NDU88_004907 [Pleurodeles waltl]